MLSINEYLTTGKTYDCDVTSYVISCILPGSTKSNKIYTCIDDDELKTFLQKKYASRDKFDWEKNIYDNVIKLKKGQAFVFDFSTVSGQPGYDVYTRINDQ